MVTPLQQQMARCADYEAELAALYVRAEKAEAEIAACHTLLDERGLSVGSEFHDDLLRRVEWLAGVERMGPKLHIENERLRAIINAVEWFAPDQGTLFCPWCAQTIDDGHTENCIRRTALEEGE